MSEQKVALGKRLFFDTRLSVNGKASCSSCHDPTRAYTDGRPVAIGATGEALPHSAMALVNVAYNISYGWTKPELASLEAQMLEPMLNEHPIELGLHGRQQLVCDQLAEDADYRAAFARSFPDSPTPITFEHIVQAIASFERTLISGHSPFDRYAFEGEHTAISAQAKRGMALFYSPRSGCGACHSGFNFSGNFKDTAGATGKPSFANNGTTNQPMKVPTLRNIALTAPYMHDGRFPTLDAVLEHYAKVAENLRATTRPRGKPRQHDNFPDVRLRQFELSPQERQDLIAFLQTLTDEGFTRGQPPSPR